MGPYTLKGRDGSSIVFMCLTMIDPATTWFEIVELQTVTKLTTIGRGWIEKFSILDTHFLPEKRLIFVRHKIQKRLRRKQAKVCGQTKIANVALSPSWGEATSVLMHPTVYTFAQPCSEISRMPLSRPSFPCWKGWDEVVLLKKPIWTEIKYTQVPTTCYCSTNIAVVGTFLSRHEQLTPISAQECCKIRGGCEGLICCALAHSKGSQDLQADL